MLLHSLEILQNIILRSRIISITHPGIMDINNIFNKHMLALYYQYKCMSVV